MGKKKENWKLSDNLSFIFLNVLAEITHTHTHRNSKENINLNSPIRIRHKLKNIDKINWHRR